MYALGVVGIKEEEWRVDKAIRRTRDMNIMCFHVKIRSLTFT